MSETEKQYSLSEEEFHGYSLDECIKNYISDGHNIEFPFELGIFIGDEVKFKASHFLPSMEDYICDQVNDECGEWSQDWQEELQSKRKNLNEDFENFFDKWCEENDCKVNFYNIENTEKVTYIIRSKDEYEVKK